MYSLEIIAAASRVSATFDSGCDRCDADDLHNLKGAGLMTTRRCTKEDAEHLDSMEAGETLFEFNEAGRKLIDAIRADKL